MQGTRRRCALAFVASLAAGLAHAEELAIVDDYPGSFTDIETIGTKLVLGDEGEQTVESTIGNALLPAGPLVIANNGGIGFAPPESNLAPENAPLPSPTAFGAGQALLGYWDDIGNDIGGVFFVELDNVLIVQWDELPIGGGDNRVLITFQIKIYDASEASNPYFQYIYEDIEPGGASATIGYQDGGAGFNDATWSYNTPGAVGAGSVLTVLPEPGAAFLLLLPIAAGRIRRATSRGEGTR